MSKQAKYHYEYEFECFVKGPWSGTVMAANKKGAEKMARLEVEDVEGLSIDGEIDIRRVRNGGDQ